MQTPRSVHMRRRAMLGVPALIAAATVAVAVRPAKAKAEPAPECLADLLKDS